MTSNTDRIKKIVERKPLYRKEAILEICKGKTVLHLGCLGHSKWEQELLKNEWLHKALKEKAKDLVGIDYLKKEIKRLTQKYDYRCYYGDAMALDKVELDEKFDVVLAGELIEHLENPGLMLEGVKRFIKKNGILIISTPQPWYLGRINLLKGYLESIGKSNNPEHVMWFSYDTLQKLLVRCNYKKISYGFYTQENPPQGWGVKSILRRALIHLTPRVCQRGLLFIAQPRRS